MNQCLTGIIPFSYFLGYQKIAGSTFIRANALANNAPDFKIWEHGHAYDQLIFQKAYWPEMMQLFKGPKILDLCDPDWVHGAVDIKETGSLADAITCSSENLTELIISYFPDKLVYYVPDRFDFKTFPAPRGLHTGKAKNLVWFGFVKNAHETLPPLASVIKKHQLKLTIIADSIYNMADELQELQPAFIKYDQQTAYHHIQNYDVVLNPRSERALFKYKSDNKSTIGWKLGVPVAENANDIERLIHPDERNRAVSKKRAHIDIEYDIAKSVEQYRHIFKQIRKL